MTFLVVSRENLRKNKVEISLPGLSCKPYACNSAFFPEVIGSVLCVRILKNR